VPFPAFSGILLPSSGVMPQDGIVTEGAAMMLRQSTTSSTTGDEVVKLSSIRDNLMEIYNPTQPAAATTTQAEANQLHEHADMLDGFELFNTDTDYDLCWSFLNDY